MNLARGCAKAFSGWAEKKKKKKKKEEEVRRRKEKYREPNLADVNHKLPDVPACPSRGKKEESGLSLEECLEAQRLWDVYSFASTEEAKHIAMTGIKKFMYNNKLACPGASIVRCQGGHSLAGR